VGGASECCDPQWSARLDGETPDVWSQAGGATFTITPAATGSLVAEWNRTAPDGLLIDAYYDPPVRLPDHVAPTVGPLTTLVRAGTSPSTRRVAASWAGRDGGWGIASFELQRRLNGGAWTAISLPLAPVRSATTIAAHGATVQFRLRATDHAGNVGAWLTGDPRSV
jgi:hypothetical protein